MSPARSRISTASLSRCDGVKVSRVTLKHLDLASHHSIRLKIGIDDHAKHPGGVNIFGRGFGNHDQDIVMRLHLAQPAAKAAELVNQI